MAAERPPSSALRAGMIGADVSRAFMAGPPPDRSPNHTPSCESPRPDGRFASRPQPRRRTRSPSPAMCTLENERRGARRNDARRQHLGYRQLSRPRDEAMRARATAGVLPHAESRSRDARSESNDFIDEHGNLDRKNAPSKVHRRSRSNRTCNEPPNPHQLHETATCHGLKFP